MLRFAAAGAVGAYQRHLSPHKGFCCAYRVHTGRVSCSEFGRRVLLRSGLLAFFRLMPRQFARCREALASLQQRHQRLHANGAHEGNHRRNALDGCDCGLSPCDLADCSPDGCDVPCDCSF